MLLSEEKMSATGLGRAGHLSGMGVLQAQEFILSDNSAWTTKRITLVSAVGLISKNKGSKFLLRGRYMKNFFGDLT
jgi:hypothetical protein